ncbi:major facilitator superfamily domain-containing protein [Cercophora newfieldiana]|uniref:Major facilitator superfamily domain-containing protein n=1 Tax=Cercophora newfieldiana TaxID=92897 RepID=A0AA39Y6J1_9PEZI|nr:major facilitator superfamily domain-containing protein [Cercophora newfieldiana]
MFCEARGRVYWRPCAFSYICTISSMNSSTVRLVENAICTRYYRDVGQRAGHDRPIPELECKIPPIQSEVINLLGWLFSIDCLPALLTAIFWGYVADRMGRRAVLALSCVGRLFAMVSLLSIGLWSGKLPARLMLLSPLSKIIGGGSRVFTAMVLSITSDQTDSSERTKIFYLMAMLMDLANVSAPSVESWALGLSLGTPFALATGLFVPVFVAIWATPESRTGLSKHLHQPTHRDDGEQTALLHGSIDTRGDTPLSPTLVARSGTASPPKQDRDSWRQALTKLTRLAKSKSILILFACSFLKRTAFFSETFFVQYASEKYRLPYQQVAWFNGVQAAGAILALGVLLPLTTHYLQRRTSSIWVIDRLLARSSLAVLVLGYTFVWLFGTIPLFAAALFFCGVGEGAEPALQGLTAALVTPPYYATLFTTLTFLESLGRLLGGPLMAYILRIGRDESGRPTGLVFLVAASLFLAALIGLTAVKEEHVGDEDAQSEGTPTNNAHG